MAAAEGMASAGVGSSDLRNRALLQPLAMRGIPATAILTTARVTVVVMANCCHNREDTSKHAYYCVAMKML